ncbi:protein-disulfide reductase DsbD [Trinickia caryophylli]|uniref:Thiol:disulfide interchange protein DsbD n=1 Tax=Trinickia caryophylli TaxID=28094 RepID=A0A1X7F560_TRICW|nr:protein-disulfide reductase DsbD [Trinickia caryophylli]PMS09238.1 protein-disulfide reductase DsbD [Trinickia caryophylli]TRX19402.1 protein-disulfide reductase DsbD [Trinickia caryophylli]WQE13290.1 protein-disulfide reductase DsbD [Trinickia caryophylli]SMF46191.1 Thiol:disulfide interchange protein DsbD [Trinickia caryophylli]GLU34388.1 thiol:disulfide interchange protein DsbD [Trinickia caryophylli]
MCKLFGAHANALARFFLFVVFVCASLAALTNRARADDFLDPSAAFRFQASEVPGAVDIRFKIADGYYLYRERFAFAVKSGSATLGEPQMPAGHVKFDQTFQKDVETYRGELAIRLPVKAAAGPFELAVTSQGCADAGICYPPETHTYRVSGAALSAAAANDGGGAQSVVGGAGAATGSQAVASWYERATSADYAQSLLQGGSFAATVGLYFVAGLVLSLLPCSYPMIPIVSAIIIGEGRKVTHARGFALSLAYVLGMALVYTALGIAAALVGQSLGAWLQNPWVLGAFAVLLTAFALSLISGVDISLPQRWHDRVSEASGRRPGGKFAAVAAMGALSALVVGACMTAPLFAVLAFIAHTGNAVLGGAALFSMAIGLGVPLMIVGLGAGTLLPRAGAWMEGIKVFFGVILLAAALWIVWPVLPPVAQMLLGALWLLLAAAALGLFSAHAGAVSVWRRLGRGIGAALAIWAAALIVGLAAGSTDPLRPLAILAARVGAPGAALAREQPTRLAFEPVRSAAALDTTLRAAGRPAMLDFYADWCVSCKEMERFTFADPRVQARLAQMQLLRADVTANGPDDQLLLKRFALFGPPGIIFFDRTGKEVLRVVGYESADTFLRSLDRVAPEAAPAPNA